MYQDILDELNWSAIEQLADRLKVDLKVSTLRLSIYPKNFLDSVLDLLDEHAINFHPTRYSHILSILRYTDGTTKKHAYRIGFSPYGSALDHDNAFKLLQDESHISRAYYKIQEACDRCGVKEWPQPTWNALDIGAAPGGWSMYLSQVVGTVYAVDPAELAISKPNVIHLRAQLQQVIPQVAEIPFHMIVCDMNDDPIVAIQCIASVIDRLVIGGRIILTFKYPKRAAANIQKRLHADVELFKKELPSCDVERTMHMVSNHHERTLVAIKTRN